MKILAYTEPARGALFPVVPLLLALQERGHDVVIRTLADEVPHMRELGFKADPLDPQIEAAVHDDYLAKGAMGAIKRAIRVMTRRAALEVQEVRTAVADESPDLLLIDTNTWGAAAVAEAWGGPWALVQHFLTPLPSPDVPPFGPGLKPHGGALGRARDRLLRPLVLGSFERVLLPPLNEVRRSVGVPPVRSLTELYTRPPLTLYATSRSFDYPRRRWPDSFCFVGPLSWDPPTDDPPWLADVQGPVVLVTTSSSFQDDGAIAETAVAGLAQEDVAVVATLPADARRMEAPPNARVERWVPHSSVLPRAEVAITHGGMGATQKALAAGVPVVVVPWGRDQLEVGRRVERAGVGVLLPRRRLSPESVRTAVRRARALKPVAERFAARVADEGGVTVAVERLERLVG